MINLITPFLWNILQNVNDFTVQYKLRVDSMESNFVPSNRTLSYSTTVAIVSRAPSQRCHLAARLQAAWEKRLQAAFHTSSCFFHLHYKLGMGSIGLFNRCSHNKQFDKKGHFLLQFYCCDWWCFRRKKIVEHLSQAIESFRIVLLGNLNWCNSKLCKIFLIILNKRLAIERVLLVELHGTILPVRTKSTPMTW